VLAEEAIPEEVRQRILAEYKELGFAKSSSKSVLGSSNDIAFHYKYRILEAGGVHSWRVPEIIRELNRMPMKAIKHTFPIEELAHLYGISV
jgi:replication-associated recombination protein RarA